MSKNKVSYENKIQAVKEYRRQHIAKRNERNGKEKGNHTGREPRK